MTTVNDELYKKLEPPHKNSPSTYLTTALTAAGTLLYTADSSIFQMDNDNPISRLTLGFDTATPETVIVQQYNADNKRITIIRGQNPKAWPINTKVARVFTSDDYTEIRNNFEWSKINIDLADDSIGLIRQDLLPIINHMQANKCNLFRGKNLGTSITTDQKISIQNGQFNDLYIGDYWVLNGTTYRIADFNYWTDPSVNKNHVVIIPDNPIALNVKMQNSNNWSNDYYFNTSMYQLNMQPIRNSIKQLFGEFSLMTYYENLPRTQYPDVDNTVACTVELMSERQVYGQSILGIEKHTTYGAKQYGLFRLRPEFIRSENRNEYWLRDLTKIIENEGGHYCRVGSRGEATYSFGGGQSNIRPAFAYNGHQMIID